MAKPECYSPQLSRHIVCRLYHKAKTESVPMTALANRLLEEALGSNKRINTPTVAKDQQITQPN